MGKFPSEEEMQNARQNLRPAKPAAGVAAAGPTQRSPRARLSGCPVELATRDVRGLDLRLSYTWTVGHPGGLQGQSVRGGPVGRSKPRFQTSPMQTARDALRRRGVHHYRGNPPQLRYTPIADAASCCRGNPSLLRYTPTADAACRCRGNPSLLRYTPTADAACRC